MGQATVTSQHRGLPPCHGIKVRPSGLLPSDLDKPGGGYSGRLERTGNHLIEDLVPYDSAWGSLTYKSVNSKCVNLLSAVALMWDAKWPNLSDPPRLSGQSIVDFDYWYEVPPFPLPFFLSPFLPFLLPILTSSFPAPNIS